MYILKLAQKLCQGYIYSGLFNFAKCERQYVYLAIRMKCLQTVMTSWAGIGGEGGGGEALFYV